MCTCINSKYNANELRGTWPNWNYWGGKGYTYANLGRINSTDGEGNWNRIKAKLMASGFMVMTIIAYHVPVQAY